MGVTGGMMHNGQHYGGGLPSASQVYYNNTTSGLAAVTAQQALDEIDSRLDTTVTRFTNRNLLDNPWFTINQRGLTTLPINAYGVDRWKNAIVSPTYSSNGITMNSESIIEQFFEDTDMCVGKNVTISIMYSDGTVESRTVFYNDKTSYKETSFSSGIISRIGIFPQWTLTSQGLLFYAHNVSVTIRAVKLEIGSHSTLVNDIAPNYAEELQKCQRYFYKSPSTLYGVGASYSSGNCWTQRYQLPVTMKSSPSVSIGSVMYFVNGVFSSATINDIYTNTDGFMASLNTPSISNGQGVVLYLSGFTASADL